MNKVVAAWQRTLRRCAGKRAVIEAASGTVCTFGELEAGAARFAFTPAEVGRRLVVFALPNGRRWLEVFIALMRAGAVAVPLDAAEPVSAQRELAANLRAAFWFDGEGLQPVAGGRRLRDRSACLIKLTSGTTGRPRPLLFSDEQMLADARQVTATMGIGRDDLNYALIPFGHSYGLGNLTFPLLAHGVPVVCGTSPLPQAIADDFARWQPTVLPTVPAVFRALVVSELAGGALASLRLAISAGAPLPIDTACGFRQKYGRRLHAFYGSSETGGIAYDRAGDATLGGGVGRPMRGVTITSLRGQRLRVCSAAVFTFRNPRRSGAAGCWSPPDRAAIDRRGEITLLGRRGTTVKISGRRINLAEVALRLRRIAGVRDAWVGTSQCTEPTLGAAVVTDRTAAEIRRDMLAETASWKVPKRWAILPEFPLTERGKTDTRALQARVFGARTTTQ